MIIRKFILAGSVVWMIGTSSCTSLPKERVGSSVGSVTHSNPDLPHDLALETYPTPKDEEGKLKLESSSSARIQPDIACRRAAQNAALSYAEIKIHHARTCEVYETQTREIYSQYEVSVNCGNEVELLYRVRTKPVQLPGKETGCDFVSGKLIW